MNNLWKKEAERTEYVNLFASVKDSGLDEMCIELFTLGKSQKDNLQSTEWLVNGNNYFCQNKWYKAMECYRKSLCFAQAGSANEALAYSNISACLLRLNWFNETLHCIELARQSNLPDRVKPTLKQRVIDCLRRMLMSPSYPVYERMHKFKPKLSYNADEDYPCMANVVEIQRNDIFGRHLVAKCDIPVGQTVLMEEDIPLIRDGELNCYNCARKSGDFIACPNCSDVTFCSVNCMNRNLFHKWECGSYFSRLPLDTRLQLKILLIAITTFPSVDDLMQFVEDALLEDPEQLPMSLNDSKSKYHFFFKLSTSAPYDRIHLHRGYKMYKAAMNLPRVSALFDNDPKERFLMHLALHHVLICNSNRFGSGEDAYVGNVSSLISHSCAPNILCCGWGNQTYSVTGRLIKRGEQLFTNYYADNDNRSIEQRKTFLKLRWGIDCKCEKCVPIRASFDKKVTTSDLSYKYVVENHKNTNDFANVVKNCIRFLETFGRSQWSPEIEFVFNVYGQCLRMGFGN